MNVLVQGFYFKNNAGDNLFQDAFIHLFPDINFIFVNKITKESLKDISAIFFGGGSFVYADPNVDVNLIKHLPIFYIGIGVEKVIHPKHIELMKIAKLIAIRSENELNNVREINQNTILIPDIVYSLKKPSLNIKQDKSILILPNTIVIPKNNSPHYSHAIWDYFKSEFSQFLDESIESGYNINFLPMCQNNELDDSWAAIEIINRMRHGRANHMLNMPNDLDSIIKIISSFSIVVTQRFHGIILAEMAEVPCLSIYHHEKIREAYPFKNESISYYELSKAKINASINKLKEKKFETIKEANDYVYLQDQVMSLLKS